MVTLDLTEEEILIINSLLKAHVSKHAQTYTNYMIARNKYKDLYDVTPDSEEDKKKLYDDKINGYSDVMKIYKDNIDVIEKLQKKLES